MSVLILVKGSSVPMRDGKCKVAVGETFQIIVCTKPNYQAAFIKVVQPAQKGDKGGVRAKVYRVELTQSHNRCSESWTMQPGTVVRVAWQPIQKRKVDGIVYNTGDHVCTLECRCVPELSPLAVQPFHRHGNCRCRGPVSAGGTFDISEETAVPLSVYPPFPGMTSSEFPIVCGCRGCMSVTFRFACSRTEQARTNWFKQWHEMEMTPELRQAKETARAEVEKIIDVVRPDFTTIKLI